MDQAESLRGLIGILRLAYSGELAAGFAYRGHWHSISDPEERLQIRKIEDEEWHHRRLVGGLLEQLGARPSVFRETRAFLTEGSSVSCATWRDGSRRCMVQAGWKAAMSGNTKEPPNMRVSVAGASL
jgi:rubrerythrin